MPNASSAGRKHDVQGDTSKLRNGPALCFQECIQTKESYKETSYARSVIPIVRFPQNGRQFLTKKTSCKAK